MICVSMLAGAIVYHIYLAFVSISLEFKHAETVATDLSKQHIISADLRTLTTIANIAFETHFSASHSLTQSCMQILTASDTVSL